jgi:hypothetical protein
LWDDLLVYVLDGRIETDNNEIENSIRSTAVGKKNCYRLSNTHRSEGARARFPRMMAA